MGIHNNRVDFYKLIMTTLCALMHFEGWFFKADRRVFEGGYLAVDFFFVLDGFLLYQSYKNGKYANAVDFTWQRFKRYFPYATSIVFGFVIMRFIYETNTGGGCSSTEY